MAGDRDVAVYRKRWSSSSFLAVVPEIALAEWLRHGELRRFQAGDVLISEGDTSTSAFLLLTGAAKVSARFDAKQETLLAVRVRGDVVGEQAALGGPPRIATVTACGRDEVVACEISAKAFRSGLLRHPDASVTLTRAVNDKFRAATRRRIDYTTRSPVVCMARALVELVDDHGHPLSDASYLITIDLTHLELGTLIGVSQRTAERALGELRGLVNMAGRRPVVHNLPALRRAAKLPRTDPAPPDTPPGDILDRRR